MFPRRTGALVPAAVGVSLAPILPIVAIYRHSALLPAGEVNFLCLNRPRKNGERRAILHTKVPQGLKARDSFCCICLLRHCKEPMAVAAGVDVVPDYGFVWVYSISSG